MGKSGSTCPWLVAVGARLSLHDQRQCTPAWWQFWEQVLDLGGLQAGPSCILVQRCVSPSCASSIARGRGKFSCTTCLAQTSQHSAGALWSSSWREAFCRLASFSRGRGRTLQTERSVCGTACALRPLLSVGPTLNCRSETGQPVFKPQPPPHTPGYDCLACTQPASLHPPRRILPQAAAPGWVAVASSRSVLWSTWRDLAPCFPLLAERSQRDSQLPSPSFVSQCICLPWLPRGTKPAPSSSPNSSKHSPALALSPGWVLGWPSFHPFKGGGNPESRRLVEGCPHRHHTAAAAFVPA